MREESTQILVEWLRDAHAMETNLAAMLETQAGRMDDYPLMRKRLRQHVDETSQHARKVEECLTLIGADTSTLKDVMGKMSGKTSPLVMAVAPDEPIKGALANISAEHFEIACYRALLAAAERFGETAIAETVACILKEEEDMAAWLEHHLPSTTVTYLSHKIGTAVET